MRVKTGDGVVDDRSVEITVDDALDRTRWTSGQEDDAVWLFRWRWDAAGVFAVATVRSQQHEEVVHADGEVSAVIRAKDAITLYGLTVDVARA